MIINNDDIDSLIRVFNNVAIAMDEAIKGDSERCIPHLKDALTWCYPLLGVEHPMLNMEGRVSPPPLLRHEDMIHLGQNVQTASVHHPK